MTKDLIDARKVEKAIRAIYRDWHQCELRKGERGIPKGTLCDGCNEMIAATMSDLRSKP